MRQAQISLDLPPAFLYRPAKRTTRISLAFACRLGNHSLSSPAAKSLFAGSKAGLVFVTAFHDRHKMVKYLDDISWETEVWVAESPTRLIHFNGERFLGPYEEEG